MEQAKQSIVSVSDIAVRVQRKHAVGDTLEDSFDMSPALFQSNVGGAKLTAGGFNLAATGLQFFRHTIEGVHQVPDFIRGTHLHPVIEPPSIPSATSMATLRVAIPPSPGSARKDKCADTLVSGDGTLLIARGMVLCNQGLAWM